MLGIIFLSVVLLYLALLVWATRRGWRWGVEKKGWTGRKRWLGAGIGFLMVYLPVFWDWLPTVATHQYYCAKESGFWVYKTVEQWKAENLGVMETLVESPISIKHVGNGNDFADTIELNQRFAHVHRFKGPLEFNRWRHEHEVVDTKTHEVLARYVDFSTSQERQQAGWNGWKFWLSSRSCIDTGVHPQHRFYEFESQLTRRQQ